MRVFMIPVAIAALAVTVYFTGYVGGLVLGAALLLGVSSSEQSDGNIDPKLYTFHTRFLTLAR